MIPTSRSDALYRLGLMPALMGLGHLAPAIGAIHTALGSYRFPRALLWLIGTASALVDSQDTYKDLPPPSRPRKWIWRLWIYSLWAIIMTCTFLSGMETSIRIYQFSLIGLLWGTPCIPHFSASSGMNLSKPKTVLREWKSLIAAISMGCVTAGSSMFHVCQRDVQCNDQSLQTRSLCLSILYQFFRETACDIRDIAEDTEDGMKTLPVRLGKGNTVLLMSVVGLILDGLLTGGVDRSLQVVPSLAFQSVVRIGFTMCVYSRILRYPRENYWAWGFMSLFGLVPVLSAQLCLLNSK
ncbi:hypothetical protein GX51_03393 [Blastomyces parvus]|uniref:Uncharacterized protein n=1 Tax=Blastomyces parvus TaxID=2060905 RepID=A0A2B7X757_9EURO|nr:hypothetical protein GX51_03393 [Blastomyces parvus]